VLKALLAQVLPKARKSGAPAATAEATTLERARELAAAKRWDEAGDLARQIIARDPEDVEATLLVARTWRARGDLEQAQQAYRRALVLAPSRADAWLDLGVCHHLAGDDFWARVYFRFANGLDPDNADVWNEFGVVDIALGNLEKAEESLENAVARDPSLPEAWNNLGLVLARRGDLTNARRHFLRATFLRPDYYTAHCNAGLAAKDLELLDDAERALRRAIEVDPAPFGAWLNLSAVLQDAGRLKEAQAAAEAALERAPGNADVLASLSTLALRRAEAAPAKALATLALAGSPEHAEARLALAHAQLAEGDYASGWPNYEARLRSAGMTVRHVNQPAWRGGPLRGKTILVWGEQGVGDQIMFASCVPDLLASGARCLLDCSPQLRPLFERSFPAATWLEGPPPPVDGALGIGSLPGIFRPSRAAFPDHGGYLRADPARTAHWRAKLASLGPGAKVGIAWRGGLLRTGQAQRSLEPHALDPLRRIPGVRWISLQRDATAEGISRWDEALADLDETAALICALDLVVTVCCTVAHLAGALGCRAWVMTPIGPAWRYRLQGEEMPWYPAVRLYRQKAPADWAGVVERVAADLRSECSGA
jgi:tetratricopeptide (TPR) repeat protein